MRHISLTQVDFIQDESDKRAGNFRFKNCIYNQTEIPDMIVRIIAKNTLRINNSISSIFFK